jgi:hypothetical protein
MSWMNKDEWSKQICDMHQIEAKLRITNILHENFVSLGKELEKLEFPEFANRQTLRTNIAIQILSVCFELTEDLAATCFSYAKAIKSNNKNVPEYLRDFGDPHKNTKEVGNPYNFYETVSKDICYAAEMAGIDPISDVKNTIIYQNFFKVVRDFRNKYDDWYQGYKHGQRTLPMYVWTGDATPTSQNVTFLIYRIPQALQEKDGKIFVEADFVDLMKEEENLVKLISDIVKAWQGVKQRQIIRVFLITAPPAGAVV